MANNVCHEDMKLVLDDDYIQAFKTYMNAASEDANRKLEILIQTVNSASTDACISGKSADMLRTFSERLSRMSGCILEYGRNCVALADQFYQEIDNVDGDLY